MSKLEGILDQVKQDLSKPVPEHGAPSKEKKMAKKVNKPEAEDEDEAPKAKKGGKAAKADKSEKKGKTGKAAKADDDGNVTLAALAAEAGISAAAARRKVRATELERNGRWAFKEGSKQLRTVRTALGLDA